MMLQFFKKLKGVYTHIKKLPSPLISKKSKSSSKSNSSIPAWRNMLSINKFRTPNTKKKGNKTHNSQKISILLNPLKIEANNLSFKIQLLTFLLLSSFLDLLQHKTSLLLNLKLLASQMIISALCSITFANSVRPCNRYLYKI